MTGVSRFIPNAPVALCFIASSPVSVSDFKCPCVHLLVF